MKDFFKHNGILILIIALLLAAITFVVSLFFGGTANPVSNLLGVITTPVRDGINAIATWAEDLYTSAFETDMIREENERLKQENARLQDKISQIRLVSRAKCCLVEHAHLTEAEAHRRIEKLAMDTRRDRTEIAQEILDSYEDVGV